MTRGNDTASKRPPSAKLRTGFAFSALLALGAVAMPALADDHHDRGEGRHDERSNDGRGYRNGYYRAPPVVYGSPYYNPPPVVYSPGIGIYMPGVAIGIR